MQYETVTGRRGTPVLNEMNDMSYMKAVRVYDRGRSARAEANVFRRQVASVLAMSTLFGSGIIVATGVSAMPAYASCWADSTRRRNEFA